ncbi:MAG: GNAT family N-acetyltransferase [Phycisphaeraceae bacterium JB051]
MSVLLSELQPTEFKEVIALCASCNTASGTAEGVRLDTSSPAALAKLLAHHPNLSIVARDEGAMVGVILCGTSGNSGLMHQLAIAPSHQNTGLDRQLIDEALGKMHRKGLYKSRISLKPGSPNPHAFWEAATWQTEAVEGEIPCAYDYASVQ